MGFQNNFSLYLFSATLILFGSAFAEEIKPNSSAELQVSSDSIVKKSLEFVLNCSGIGTDSIRLTCFDATAEGVEAWASANGWDVDALKSEIQNTGTNTEGGASENNNESAPVSKWFVTTNKSEIDDTTNVYLALESDTDISARFGKSGPMQLYIHCLRCP